MAEEFCFNEQPMGFGGWNIGDDCTPICWNYTARYKRSNRVYKMSGPGSFPRELCVPGNIDTSTGIMVDDGVLIHPDEYEVNNG